jgi:hypothetical protein
MRRARPGAERLNPVLATRSRWEERRCAWFMSEDEDADQAPMLVVEDTEPKCH